MMPIQRPAGMPTERPIQSGVMERRMPMHALILAGIALLVAAIGAILILHRALARHDYEDAQEEQLD